ncbi:MAG: PASTA domain-containing protein [Longimicrobiales bacterium]
MRRRQQGKPAATAGPEDRRTRTRAKPINWRFVIPVTLAVLLLPFAVGYAFAVFVLFPAPKVEGGGGLVVPNVIGQTVDEARNAIAAAGLGGIEVMPLPHPDAVPGTITAQNPLPGQELRAGAGISVSISSGRSRVTVPDVEGLAPDAARQILVRLGFDVRIMEKSSMTAVGRVFRMDPVSGAAVQLPATVIIAVSTGPLPLDSLSTPPDTMRAREAALQTPQRQR